MERFFQRHAELSHRLADHFRGEVGEDLHHGHGSIVLLGRGFLDAQTSGREHAAQPIEPLIAATGGQDDALTLKRVDGRSEQRVRADDARFAVLKHRLHGVRLD